VGKLTRRPERLFYFRLALALGVTVQDLLVRISSSELTEWMAYYQMEPFGEERADLRSAIVASVTANAASKRRFKPADFMPRFDRPKPQSEGSMRQMFQAAAKAFGGDK